MHIRKKVLQLLVYKSQIFTFLREAILVGSQFLVVFIALGIREQIGMTAQVAAAFIGAATCLDAIISYSRAYGVYTRVSS